MKSNKNRNLQGSLNELLVVIVVIVILSCLFASTWNHLRAHTDKSKTATQSSIAQVQTPNTAAPPNIKPIPAPTAVGLPSATQAPPSISSPPAQIPPLPDSSPYTSEFLLFLGGGLFAVFAYIYKQLVNHFSVRVQLAILRVLSDLKARTAESLAKEALAYSRAIKISPGIFTDALAALVLSQRVQIVNDMFAIPPSERRKQSHPTRNENKD